MFVALKGGRQRGYLLALVFFTLQLQIEVLIFKQRKYFTVFLALWTQILSCKFFIIGSTRGN